MAATLPTRSRGRSRRAPMSEINVTPLVDVMLVLLIIFMVTAPLLVAGVPVDLPESRAGALDQQAKPVQIALDRDGGIFIDDAPSLTPRCRAGWPPSPPSRRRPKAAAFTCAPTGASITAGSCGSWANSTAPA